MCICMEITAQHPPQECWLQVGTGVRSCIPHLSHSQPAELILEVATYNDKDSDFKCIETSLKCS